MADIERERHVSTVERDSSSVWIVVALLVVVLLVLLFIWPGWVYTPFAGDTDDGDTINIEQPDQDVDVEQPDQDVDVDVEQPDVDVDVEQPDEGTEPAPEGETTP